MSNNDFIISGSISLSSTNVPTRAGQRISSLSELESISTPFVGMIIYVENDDIFIYVKSLKSKKVGNFEIKNAVIDEYKSLSSGVTLNWNEVL